MDENIAATRRVTAEAHAVGAWVEAELVGIGGGEDRSGGAAGLQRTDPVLAERFVVESGVDALAIAIGKVHGVSAGRRSSISSCYRRSEAGSRCRWCCTARPGCLMTK